MKQDNPKLRVAIDFGRVKARWSEEKIVEISDGKPLRIAARLEPLVKPQEIWITETVKNLLNSETGGYEAVEIRPQEASHIPYQDGYFDIKKSEKEENIRVKLYRVVSRKVLDQSA